MDQACDLLPVVKELRNTSESIHCKDAIFRTAQQPPLTVQYLIDNQIRPVAFYTNSTY